VIEAIGRLNATINMRAPARYDVAGRSGRRRTARIQVEQGDGSVDESSAEKRRS
jgi:hypothetical protein